MNQQRKKRVLCWSVLFFIPFITLGQRTIILDESISGSVNIGEQVRMFWDNTGELAWKELRENQDQLEWDDLDSLPPFRKGPGKYWVHFKVQNLSKDNISGIVRCFRYKGKKYHQIHTFIESESKLEQQYSGRLISAQRRAYPTCKDCLTLHLVPGEQKTYWIELVYAYGFDRDMEFWLVPKEVIQEDRRRDIMYSLPSILFNLFFLGVIFSFFLFSGVQFFQYREKADGWYAVYLFAIFIHQLRNIEAYGEFGIIFHYFMESYYPMMVPIALITYYAYFKFLDEFLDFSSLSRFHNFSLRYLWIWMILYGLIDIVIRLFVGIRFSVYVFDLMGIPMLLMTLYYVYLANKTKSRLAFFIITGTLFMVIGNVTNAILDNIYHFPLFSQQSIWHSSTTYFRLGILIEIFFFSLGLGYKTRLAFRQKFEMEQEIAESRHIMELDAFKRKFYTNITHEFRTPLTIILGMADQIKSDTSAWLKEGTSMIQRNANDLLRLVNQMLDLNKLESGQLSTQLIQSDIIDFITYLLESFQSYAETQRVQLKIQTEVPSLYMDYDPQKIQQIISNLVSNAIKFTPEKGEVKIKLATEKDHLLITIEDSGIGIPVAQLPYIFDRFYQAQQDTNEQKGTGIGLALTKELVKLLKGDIQVTSEEKVGSIFTISLPISREAQLIEPTEYEDQEHGMQSYHVDKQLVAEENEATDLPLILLVEDNADVIRYIDSLLASKYRLAFAQNGQEGIDKATSIIPDLIISDVMMPEKDGFELCQSLKSSPHTSHIPIILLTARTEIEAKLAGLEYGADAYLAKPFNKSELLVRIRKLLEVREQLKNYYLSLINPQHDIPSNLAPASKIENAFVIQAREIVMAHLADERFAVKDFCLEIGMSHSQLHRKLVALTGYSSNRFIRFIRLTQAKHLIKAEGYSISEAAFATSYKDPSYFARVFRKEFGISPSDFKESS
ncbi:MAG: ATP-binding protein [Bacteroidota bacterium]